jgi:hypothetical protein
LEYIALTALVAIVCIGTVKTLGNKVKEQTDRVTLRFAAAMRVGPAPARGGDSEEGDDDGAAQTGGGLPRIPSLPRFPWAR